MARVVAQRERLALSAVKPTRSWRFVDRGAVPEDAGDIARLIGLHAESGGTLQRDVDDVRASIGEFIVAEGFQNAPTPTLVGETPTRGWIGGCAALVVFSPALAEIRSVAVDPQSQGMGLGRRVVERLVAEAAGMEIDRVVLFTQAPGFFRKCGFSEVDEAFLPTDFMEEMIVARGRTCAGRTIMLRSLS